MRKQDDETAKLVARARSKANSHRHKTIIFSQKEAMELQALMDKEGWKNFSGFAKRRILGKEGMMEYRKALESGDQTKIINILNVALNGLLSEQRFKDYQYEVCLKNLTENVVGADDDQRNQVIADYIVLLNRKIEEEKEIYQEYYPYIIDIAEALGLEVDMSDEAYLRALPDWEIEKRARNWNDTTSPYFRESVRRKMEKGIIGKGIDLGGDPNEESMIKELDRKRQER